MGSIDSKVGRVVRKRGPISSWSKPLATTTRAPAERAENENPNPPMWEHDEPGSKTSCGVNSNAKAALANIQPSDSRVWVTPFAGPVEPEVKKMATGSSGPGSGSVIAGASALSSA